MERRWKVLLVVSVGNVMTFLDLFIVNIAFPDIAREFPSASLATLSWILNSYTIILAALLVPAGRWADLVGRKRIFVAGLVVFLAGSAAAAAATSVDVLIAARAVQAIGGAMMIPSSLALILPEFPISQRATAVGAWAAVGAVAAAAGPPIGGLLVESSWRLVFIVNLPIGLALIVASLHMLSESKDSTAEGRPDIIGAFLLAVGIGALALSIVQGPDWGWTSARVLAGFTAAATLIPFVLLRSARHPAPVVELSILRVRSFALSLCGLAIFFAGFSALLLSTVLFLTTVWGYSILTAGLALAPGPLLAAVASVSLGRLGDHFGQRLLGAAGAAFFALAGVWWAWRVGPTPRYATALPALVLTGIGAGLAVPALMTIATASLPAHRIATGTAVMVMFRQIGGALGVAILVAILGSTGSIGSLSDYDHAWGFVAITALITSGFCLALHPPPKQRSGGAQIALGKASQPVGSGIDGLAVSAVTGKNSKPARKI